jgi:hypothetical protein
MFWSFRTKQSNKHDLANILVRCLLGSTLTVTVTAYLSCPQRSGLVWFGLVPPIARLLACLVVAISLAGNKGQGGAEGGGLLFSAHMQQASKHTTQSCRVCTEYIHRPTCDGVGVTEWPPPCREAERKVVMGER